MRTDDKETIRQYFLGQEDGHIYFFYRPKAIEAHSIDDVASLLVVLRPLDSKTFRLISLDTPRLPVEGDNFNMTVGHVEKADAKQHVIVHELAEKSVMVGGVPQVKKAAARPCGEGVYTIVIQENRAHLVYVLELPRVDGRLRDALRIGTEGNLVIGVYNPLFEVTPEEEPATHKPNLDETLKANLGTDHIIYHHLPQLLNYSHVKLAIFKESSAETNYIQKQLHPLKDTQQTADIFSDLKLQKEKYPVLPLLRGEWQ
ncbi:MAG TPA: hypothetical protein VHO70_06595 [Chitinispirillaceae bacterium]|nr:hypothetical protein [Chitinispirillaceae bacterium]